MHPFDFAPYLTHPYSIFPYICPMLPKLPIGIQTFRPLREDGYWYVDKTELIVQLAESGKYFFLSRPRRFGKSLLMSTIKELYSGDKALFSGLWAEKHWDWNKHNPVIHIAFNAFAGAQ